MTLPSNKYDYAMLLLPAFVLYSLHRKCMNGAAEHRSITLAGGDSVQKGVAAPPVASLGGEAAM